MRTHAIAYLIAAEDTLESRVRARLEIADSEYGRKVLVRTIIPDVEVGRDLLHQDLATLEAISRQAEAARKPTTTASQPDIPFTLVVVVDLGDPDTVARSLPILHKCLEAMEELKHFRPATMSNALVQVMALWPFDIPNADHMTRLWAWVKEVNYLARGTFVDVSRGPGAPKEAIPDSSRAILRHAGEVSDIVLLGCTNYHASRNPEGLKTLAPGRDRTLQWNCVAEVLTQMVLRSGVDEAKEPFPPDARTRLYACGVSSLGFAVEPVRQAFAAHRVADIIGAYLQPAAQEPTDDEVARGLGDASAEAVLFALAYGGLDRTSGNVFESVFSRLVMDFGDFVKPPWKPDLEWSLELPYRILHHRDILAKTHYEEAQRQVERVRDIVRDELTCRIDAFFDRYVGVVEEQGATGAEGAWRLERARAALRKMRHFLIRQAAVVHTTAVVGVDDKGGGDPDLASILNDILSVFNILGMIRSPRNYFGRLYEGIAGLFSRNIHRKRLWLEVEAGPGSVDQYYQEFVDIVQNQPLPEAVWLRNLALGFPLAVGCSYAAEVHQYGLPIPLLNIGWFGVPAVVFPVVCGGAVAFSYGKNVRWRRRISDARDRLLISILKDFQRRLRDEILGAARQIFGSLIAHVGDPDDLQNRDPESLAALLDEWKAGLAAVGRELGLRLIEVPRGVESPFFVPVRPPEDQLGYGQPLKPFDPFEELGWLIGSAEVRAFSRWRTLARVREGLAEAAEGWMRAVARRGYAFLDDWPLTEVLKLLPEMKRAGAEARMASTSFPFLDIPPDALGSVLIGEAVVCEPEAREEAARLFPSLSGLRVKPLPGWKAVSRLRVLGDLTWRLIPAMEIWRRRYRALPLDERSRLHTCPEFAHDCLDPMDSMSVTYPPFEPVDDGQRI